MELSRSSSSPVVAVIVVSFIPNLTITHTLQCAHSFSASVIRPPGQTTASRYATHPVFLPSPGTDTANEAGYASVDNVPLPGIIPGVLTYPI